MKHIRILSLFVVIFVSLALILGADLGDSLLTNQSAAHRVSVQESSNHCHPICLSGTESKLKDTNIKERDPDPDPFWSATYNLQSVAILYAVAINSLAILWLRRRPPDLIIRYSCLRN